MTHGTLIKLKGKSKRKRARVTLANAAIDVTKE